MQLLDTSTMTNQEQTPQPSKRVRISLLQLTVSEDFQIRSKLDARTINRYANAIKSGRELPPVRVALVDGVPILVDGFHRVAAQELLGATTVEAELVEATYQQAQWMAASANLEHGLPLKPKEIREVFRVFIRTGQHRKGKGKLKSYREIGRELGCAYTTIRNWMMSDFPRIFRQYAGSDEFFGQGGLQDAQAAPAGDIRKGLEVIEEFRRVYRAASSPEAKEALREAFRATAQELLGSGWEECQEDF